MSAKSILEADGKAILNYHLTRAPVIKPTPLPASATHNAPPKLASLHFPADADVNGILDQAEATYPWLLAPGAKFVAKPDQLIKRRGKSGLLALNKPWSEARAWVAERAGKPQKVETVDGVLRQFLVEPFVPHAQDTEYYININSVREVRCFPSVLLVMTAAVGPWRRAAAQVVDHMLFSKRKEKKSKACNFVFQVLGRAERGLRTFCSWAGRTKGIACPTGPLLQSTRLPCCSRKPDFHM